MKRHFGLYVIVITLWVSLTAAVFSPGVSARAESATLELTVYQVEVIDEAASITGLAEGVKVELYDNLGEELIDSGTVDSDGKVTFVLDDQYPLSGRGLYHTVVVVDGTSNGDITCEQGLTCQVDVFSGEGFDPDSNDALLIVKVVRSADLVTPVEGVQVNVWPADANDIPLVVEKSWNGKWYSNGQPMVVEYIGVPCISNADGYCAAYLARNYRWEERNWGQYETNTVVKFGTTIIHDASYNWVRENGLTQIQVTVDQDDKIDDCITKSPPARGTINQSCLEKVHLTATAEALGPADPVALEALNNALVQASLLSKDTMELFADHAPDEIQISEMLKAAEEGSIKSGTGVKLILHVFIIVNNEFNAAIGDPAVDAKVEITSPDNPDHLLGACQVNRLGECITIIDRSILLAADSFLKFHVVADGFDNGVMVCRDEPICDQFAYTAIRFRGYNDAVVLYKVVNGVDYSLPVQGLQITAGRGKSGYYRGCYSDKNGICPIYVDDSEFAWKTEGDGDAASPGAEVNWNSGFDINHPLVKDDRLVIYYLAVDKLGKLEDCTFASPLDYEGTGYHKYPDCAVKKKALQTAIAGYTATPTVTVTPTITVTPTVTATPLPSATPTMTLTPTPTPQPGLFAGESAPLAFGGITLLIILLGGGAWWLLRARNKRS
jgi:hypothetical protein